MNTFKIGDRVRMVQTDSQGTIVGEVFTSPTDGGPRQEVKWDRTQITNAWDPGFLRPVITDPSLDPDEIICGNYGRRREKVVVKHTVTIVKPEGFFKVE